MRDIGKNIRQLRVQKHMTQDDLAEKLFVTRQTVSNYEMGKTRPDIDMLVKISEVLDTDLQTVIYGTAPKAQNPELRRLILGFILTGAFGILWAVLAPIAEEIKWTQYMLSLEFFIYLVIKPLFCLVTSWTLIQLLGMALKKKPLQGKWVRRIGVILLLLVLVWLGLSLLYSGLYMLDEWLYVNHLRGEWVEEWYEADGEAYLSKGWTMKSLPVTDVLGRIVDYVYISFYRARIPYHILFLLSGGALWLCGIPRKKASE